MFRSALGVKNGGRPEEWVSRSKMVIGERAGVKNSGMMSQIFEVSANWPRSIARNASTLVTALVTEKMLNTESMVSARVWAWSCEPMACWKAISPPRATISTAPLYRSRAISSSMTAFR